MDTSLKLVKRYPTCGAYRADGRLCGQRAIFINRKGGYMVCGAHVPPGRLGDYVRRDEAEHKHELGGES